MKTIIKTITYLQVAALCLATAFAAPNQKEKELRGSVRSTETGEFVGAALFVEGSGTGQARHLGQFTYTFEAELDVVARTGVSSAEYTAANGDRFFTTGTGFSVPTATPGIDRVVEAQTIVGGTGRFAGASGSFTLDRLINFATSVSEGTVDGTIVIRKNNFKGSIQAVETYDVQFPTLFAHGSGTGQATHLGRFAVTYEYEINILAATGTGPAHFVAANGDSLFTEVSGQGNPTDDPDISLIVETHTITGGTGRFAGATGTFTVERLISLSTGLTSGSFEGTIVLHKATHKAK